ncbi:MAG TPA: hypothetical protein VMQ83_05465, partial [Gammaproteobacteria bacterium]|nr:hypothetical protein [Gammaproteobacteria bacterium]
MMRMPRSRNRRSPWRLLLRVLAVLLLIPAVPAVAWWVYNRIDEPPSAEARKLERPGRAVPDADNAWLYLLGIGAPEGVDPVLYGRQRVDSYEAWMLEARPGADAPEFRAEDAIPEVDPDTGIDGVDALCPARDTDCLHWAAEHEHVLERLRKANALRLQRSERLLAMPDWHAVTTPSMQEPYPDAGVLALRANLLALDLHRTLARDPDRTATALERLADEVDFCRRVRAHPQDAITTLVAARRVETAQRIAASALDRLPRRTHARTEAALDRVLSPLPAPADWSETIRREYQIFAQGMSVGVPGPMGALGQCFDGTAEKGCLKTFLLNSAYARQATLNLHAR